MWTHTDIIQDRLEYVAVTKVLKILNGFQQQKI